MKFFWDTKKLHKTKYTRGRGRFGPSPFGLVLTVYLSTSISKKRKINSKTAQPEPHWIAQKIFIGSSSVEQTDN